MRVWRQKVSIDFEKKIEKIWFFQFFLKQIILFLFEIDFYVKNAFFRGIACWNSSRITKFEIFAHTYWFFEYISNFWHFLVISGKAFKMLNKKAQNSEEPEKPKMYDNTKQAKKAKKA